MNCSFSDIPGDILKAAEDIPAISPVMSKINEISRQMDTSPIEMVKIIMLDPVLTGKVIKLVNSSFYGLPQHINSLAQAVVLLGMNTVKNLAISTAVFSSLFAKQNSSPLQPEEFWQHCLGAAVGCKLMARNLKISSESSETFFIAGLLHDVGKILFIRTDSVRYKKALEESSRFGVSLCFSEQAHFGCSHTQAGGVLAKKWKLDGAVARAIELHHEPQCKNDSLMDVIIIVNNMCKKAGIGQSGNGIVEEIAGGCEKRMKVNRLDWNRVAEQLPVEVEKAAEFLKFFKE